jgi:hypothetical protein
MSHGHKGMRHRRNRNDVGPMRHERHIRAAARTQNNGRTTGLEIAPAKNYMGAAGSGAFSWITGIGVVRVACIYFTWRSRP